MYQSFKIQFPVITDYQGWMVNFIFLIFISGLWWEFLRKFQKKEKKKRKKFKKKEIRFSKQVIKAISASYGWKKNLAEIYHPSLSALDLHYIRCNHLCSLLLDSVHYCFFFNFLLKIKQLWFSSNNHLILGWHLAYTFHYYHAQRNWAHYYWEITCFTVVQVH